MLMPFANFAKCTLLSWAQSINRLRRWQMCLTGPMSFAACLGGQKLSKYAQHKYRKEDSGELSEHRRRGSLRLSLSFSLSERAPDEFQVLILYKHTYVQQRVWGGERLHGESSRVSSAARRQQLKHRNCRSPSFEHPLPPLHYRYSLPGKSFSGWGITYKPVPILALWRIARFKWCSMREVWKYLKRVESRAGQLIKKRKPVLLCFNQKKKIF